MYAMIKTNSASGSINSMRRWAACDIPFRVYSSRRKFRLACWVLFAPLRQNAGNPANLPPGGLYSSVKSFTSSAVRSAIAAGEDALVGCVRSFPHPAQAIQRRRSHGRREIAVRSASAERFLQLHAQFRRHFPCRPEKSHRLCRSLHRRPVQSPLHLDGAPPVERPQRAKLPVQRRRVPHPHYPNVDLRPRLRRHHVASCSARYHPRVHRHPALEPRELCHPLDLPRQFHDGARPRLEIHSRVRRPPPHRHRITAHSFARGFESSFQARSRLQHQHRMAPRRVLLRQRPRIHAPHLFIGIQLQHHSGTRRKLHLPHRPRRENEKRDARFHVQHARPPQPSILFPERHRPQRAQRPHCVRMPERQDLPPLAPPRQIHLAHQVLAEPAAAHGLHLGERRHRIRHQFREPVHRLRRVARRFAFHKPPDQGNNFRLTSLNAREDVIHSEPW